MVANVTRVREELKKSFGFTDDETLLASGRTGQGVDQILPAIIQSVPP